MVEIENKIIEGNKVNRMKIEEDMVDDSQPRTRRYPKYTKKREKQYIICEQSRDEKEDYIRDILKERR